MTKSQHADLLILGAGVAGLAAAWRASARGLSVVVLDHADHVGGLAASFQIAGMDVDYGSHRLPAALPTGVAADLAILLGGDLQTRVRRARVHTGGAWVDLGGSGAQFRRRLSRPLLAAMVRDRVLERGRRGAVSNYAEAMRPHVGRTVYTQVHEPYARKIWGLAPERLEAVHARQIVSVDPPWRPYGKNPDAFCYPRRGFGQIATALDRHAREAGAQIMLGTAVGSISPTFGSVSVLTHGGAEFTAQHAFSTLPLPQLARLTRPGPPLSAIETATRLRFRAMLLVYLVHRGGRWTPYDAHHFPAADTPVLRVCEPANFRDSADDPADRSVICAELPCAAGDELWSSDDSELAHVVSKTATRYGLPELATDDVVVHRSAAFYPLYQVGLDPDLHGLDAWLRRIPSVTSFGRFGLNFHDNTDHALMLAREAVDALGPDGAFDHPRWEQGSARVDALAD
ncbi:MAG: protoporphyrinogen/coproporphyrinogen oxidase [Sporichthyaceae bacterium]